MATPDLIRTLTGGLKNLSAQDARFARDLILSFETRGLSDKQLYWVERLANKAAGKPEVTTKVEAVGDLAGVHAMFETAKTHLKSPAVVLGYKRGHEDRELRIYVAGARSSTPGALQIKDAGDDTWFGRVHPNGQFEHSRKTPPPFHVTEVLKAFSADPVGVAAAHGHLTGKCCFCNRPLSDERSTAVGYGPVCAEHFGLAWGARAEKAPAGATAQPKALAAPAPAGGHFWDGKPDPEADAIEAELAERLRDHADDIMEMVWEHEHPAGI